MWHPLRVSPGLRLSHLSIALRRRLKHAQSLKWPKLRTTQVAVASTVAAAPFFALSQKEASQKDVLMTSQAQSGAPLDQDGNKTPPFLICSRDEVTVFGYRMYTSLAAICGVTTTVFLMWRVLPVQFMSKHFTSSLQGVVRGRVHTLVTSTFSHQSFPHLAFNLVPIVSFSTILVEAMDNDGFLKYFVGAGVFANLAGLVLTAAVTPRRHWAARLRPGHGASGAVLAVFTTVALMYPDASGGLLFLPFVVTLKTLLTGVIAVDTAGLLYTAFVRPSIMGHGVHLCGILFGYLSFTFYLQHYNRHVKAAVRRRELQTGR